MRTCACHFPRGRATARLKEFPSLLTSKPRPAVGTIRLLDDRASGDLRLGAKNPPRSLSRNSHELLVLQIKPALGFHRPVGGRRLRRRLGTSAAGSTAALG